MSAHGTALALTCAVSLAACTYDFSADLAACRAEGWCSDAGVRSTTPPTLSGDPVTGARLFATPGEWAGRGSLSFEYRWERCPVFAAGVACADIADAGSAEYEVSPLDVDNAVRVVVTASDETGAASATSELSPPITRGTPSALDDFTGFEAGSIPEGSGILGTASRVEPAISRHGSYALAMDAGVYVGWNRPSPLILRTALRVDALPADGGTNLLRIQPRSGGLIAHWDLLPDGNLSARHADTGAQASTHPLTPGSWHVLEIFLREGTSGTVIDWRLDGALQPAITANASLIQDLAIVFGLNGTVSMQLDDFAASSSASAWPIGDGESIALWPDGDGTHEAPSAFQRTPTSGSFASAVDDGAFGDATDYVEQTTASGTAYVELTLRPERTVRAFANALRTHVGFGQTTGPASPNRVQLWLGSEPVADHGFASEAAYAHRTSPTFAAPDAGWTDARLRTELRARWGYALPASGAAYIPVRLHRLLLEADVAR